MSAAPPAPSLGRRLACLLYESLILFGLLLLPGALGAVLAAMAGRAPPVLLGAVSMLLFGAYFVGFWSTRGQTLPMQTWRIRIETNDGRPPGRARALARHLAAYAWVLPALGLAMLNGWSPKTTLGAVAVGVLGYALLSLLHPQRQFWHDALCGTRLVDVRPPHAPG